MYQDSLNILDTRIGRIEQGSGTVRNATVKLYHFVSHDASNRTAPVIPFPITASSCTDCFMHSGWNLKPNMCVFNWIFSPPSPWVNSVNSRLEDPNLFLDKNWSTQSKVPSSGKPTGRRTCPSMRGYTDGFGATNFGIFWDSINISNSSRLNIDKYGLKKCSIKNLAQLSIIIQYLQILLKWFPSCRCPRSHLSDSMVPPFRDAPRTFHPLEPLLISPARADSQAIQLALSIPQ